LAAWYRARRREPPEEALATLSDAIYERMRRERMPLTVWRHVNGTLVARLTGDPRRDANEEHVVDLKPAKPPPVKMDLS
jgi:hypothetical protein